MGDASRRPSRPRPLRPMPSITRPNDCTVTLPVEIDVKVKVRSKCKPYGSSRTRGGMSLEYPPEQEMILNERIMSGNLNIEESNGPIPVLHEILKKQHKILRNLESSSTPSSLSPRKNLSLSNKRDRATTNQNLNEIVDESSNDEEEENKQNDNEKDNLNVINEKQSEKQSKSSKPKKYTNKNVMSSLSEGIKVNRNISFDNDEILTQDNKKSKKKDKRLKGGQTNIPLASNFEDEENSYQFDIQESQMVELFNRRKLKVTKIDQTSNVGEKNKTEMDKEEKLAHKDKNYGR